jgi:hypothetical protein
VRLVVFEIDHSGVGFQDKSPFPSPVLVLWLPTELATFVCVNTDNAIRCRQGQLFIFGLTLISNPAR